MTAGTFFRVQDAAGRGPWRPGLSSVWCDEAAPSGRLTETIFDLVPVAVLRGLSVDHHWGSACRSLDALWMWFTALEQSRLEALGFHPVQLVADVVLGESDWQAVIGRRRPFWDGATRRRWEL